MPAGSPVAAHMRPLEEPFQISAPQAPRGPTREEPGCSQTSDPPDTNSVKTSPQDPSMTSRCPGSGPTLSSAQGASQAQPRPRPHTAVRTPEESFRSSVQVVHGDPPGNASRRGVSRPPSTATSQERCFLNPTPDTPEPWSPPRFRVESPVPDGQDTEKHLPLWNGKTPFHLLPLPAQTDTDTALLELAGARHTRTHTHAPASRADPQT